MRNLENCLGLHERLHVLYVVDGYVASLEHESVNREYAKARGKTIQKALRNLNRMLKQGPWWRDKA